VQCVDSAQPLAIGGGIHNTAENKACPAQKQQKPSRFQAKRVPVRVKKTRQNKN